jgi:FAD/FMN-containing dehydrogenase
MTTMAVAPARIQKKRLREALGGQFGSQFRAHPGSVVGTVWPKDERELVTLVRAAAQASSPLVPRGIGSSPYAAWASGRGLTVSFEHMDAILDVDQQHQLVRVQPGVVWQNLIDHLRPFHLMPLVYPSSGAVSTVGGFVAQGGAGVGSYEFGWVEQTVETLRLIDAEGEAIELDHPTSHLAVGAEGRTGLLSEIRLRLQPLETMLSTVGLFDDVAQLEKCIALCARNQLDLWSVSYIDSHAGRVGAGLGQARQPFLPPTQHALLLSFRESCGSRETEGVRAAVSAAGGQVSAEIASHEQWFSRFMGLQTLHTTPLPMQYRLPGEQLAALIAKITPETRMKIGFEGVAVNAGSAVVVRFFLLQRHYSNSQNLDSMGELTPLVHELGGVPYGTGAFFLDDAVAVYGTDRLEQFHRFRAEHDPHDLLNPGKAFRSSPVHSG